MKNIKIKKGLISQKLKNKINIFDGEESTIYSFNETATFIFEKIKQGQSQNEIIEELTKKYSIEPGAAKRDFEGFTEDLRKKNIIN